jgi:Uma2 family endonuclease
MAETPVHRNNMTDLIGTLGRRYRDDVDVYVSGNMMMYFVKGNPRKHVSPDVFVVFGIPKLPERDIYLVWKEGKGPDVAFELTSKSTRKEDTDFKMELYRDVLKVKEYFLFDPYAEYLDPPLQGHRLQRGRYREIQPVDGRLPSLLLGLHLERSDRQLRLYDPNTRLWLPTPDERGMQADVERQRADQEQNRADQEQRLRLQAEAEIVRLRQQLDEYRSHNGRRNGK